MKPEKKAIAVQPGDRIEGEMVFDATAGIFLRRVARDPGPTDYVRGDDGTFTFSPEIGPSANGKRNGHEIHITYDLVGPRVTMMNKKKRMRA